MNKLPLYRIATIVLPLIGLFVAVGLVVFEWQRLVHLQTDLTQTENHIALLQSTVREMQTQPKHAMEPTAPISPDEQPQFLNQLRLDAQQTHVQLVKWSNTPPPSPGSIPPSQAQANAGAVPITSNVEAMGTYANLRSFLYDLERGGRLYNLSSIKWTRDAAWPQTHLAFTLTRYVSPQTSPAGKTAAATPNSSTMEGNNS